MVRRLGSGRDPEKGPFVYNPDGTILWITDVPTRPVMAAAERAQSGAAAQQPPTMQMQGAVPSASPPSGGT